MLEQHPVPQNVTTFQFRLIGDMTIKQFGYLAAGAILAYIAYNLPLPFFFTWPLTAVFALGGIGFAFVPVEQRSMDVWFLSFIKSVYSPTLYIWQRDVKPTTPTPVISTSPSSPMSVWQTFFTKKKQTAQHPTVLASTPIPTTKPVQKPLPATTPTPPPPHTPAPTPPPITPPPDPQSHVPTLEEKLNDALQDKKRLEEELATIKQMMMAQQHMPKPDQAKHDKQIYTPSPQRTAPNVITGVVRGQTGELLHSILVTVKDKDDVPPRALKTNKMGQFASSTPLPLGTYSIDVEDPKGTFFFQPVSIVLDGKPIESVTIIAKTKQDLDRQKLADSLFGKKD